jgi:4-amino-4-deoxy-L-arabinose transferase-like glycosyltransferase
VKKTFLLFLIIILAAILRVYKITENPPSLYWDEVAIGYNAYSINQTGKDEWGISWPTLFRSYDDYKPPVYIYTVALFQKVMGPTDLSVRLPSAIAGILTVIFIYFLTKELFGTPHYSLLAALLLSTSMWHIQFSRAGFEANLALMFVVLAVWLFLMAIRENIKLLFLSLLSFILSVASYANAKLFVPPFLLILMVLNAETLKKNFKQVLMIFAISAIFFIPVLPIYFSKEGNLRAASESILTQEGNLWVNFQKNYLGNFSFDYLFFHGDQAGRHSVKKLGELYLWQLPFFLIGAYQLIREKNKFSLLIFAWLLLAALPPALTKVSPHALRGLLMVIPLQIIIAVGLLRFWKLAIPFALFSLLLYLHIYYVHYPKAYSADWQDGFEATISYLKTVVNDYDDIYIHESIPEEYLKWYRFSGYSYYNLANMPVRKNPDKKVLIVAPPYMVSKDTNVKKEIRMYGGDAVFKIYEL